MDLTSAEPPSPAVIIVNTDLFPPGFDSDDEGIKLPITLLNATGSEAGGLQFDLDLSALQNSAVTEVVIHPDLDALGYELRAEPQPNGDLRIIIFTLDPDTNGHLPTGDRDVALICLTTDPLDGGPEPIAPLGASDPIAVVEGSVFISDPQGVLIGSSG